MHYPIIRDEARLREFIEWLPELEENEKFYCTLFTRKKYMDDPSGAPSQSQMRRFLATKQSLFGKIRQLEVPLGAYEFRNGKPVPPESLALYINPNPRNLFKATYQSIIELTKMVRDQASRFNPHQEVLSCIQKTKGRRLYLDFDIDDKEFDFRQIEGLINPSALSIMETRGGYHVLVELAKIEKAYQKTFYQGMKALEVDQVGDQLLPVMGATQGGFSPRFVSLESLLESPNGT